MRAVGECVRYSHRKSLSAHRPPWCLPQQWARPFSAFLWTARAGMLFSPAERSGPWLQQFNQMKTNSSFTRRNFLKLTTLAGVAPFVLPSHIWSAETPPNSLINLGFIGMGTQNRGLMGGFLRHSGTRVVAVCDVDTT